MAVLRLLQFSEFNCNLRQLHHYHHDMLEARALGRREWKQFGRTLPGRASPRGQDWLPELSGISNSL